MPPEVCKSIRSFPLSIDRGQVPEAATLLLGNGASVSDGNRLQTEILMLQLHMEDTFRRLFDADCGKPCVLLCDRGLMDGSAYGKEFF